MNRLRYRSPWIIRFRCPNRAADVKVTYTSHDFDDWARKRVFIWAIPAAIVFTFLSWYLHHWAKLWDAIHFREPSLQTLHQFIKVVFWHSVFPNQSYIDKKKNAGLMNHQEISNNHDKNKADIISLEI